MALGKIDKSQLKVSRESTFTECLKMTQLTFPSVPADKLEVQKVCPAFQKVAMQNLLQEEPVPADKL